MATEMRLLKVSLFFYLALLGHSMAAEPVIGKWSGGGSGGSTPVLGRTGERFLTYAEVHKAGAVLVAMPTNSQLASGIFTDLLSGDHGLLEIKEYPQSNFIEIAKALRPKAMNQYVEALELDSVNGASEKLRSFGFSPDRFAEIRIVSKPFNLLKGTEEASQTSIHLIDAKTLFNVEGTIAIIYRRNTWKQWGFENIHDPFSFGKNTIKVRLFTESEFKLLEQATKKLNISYRFAPIGPNYPNEYATEFKALRQWLIQVNGVKK
jgi:hypothetical protein